MILDVVVLLNLQPLWWKSSSREDSESTKQIEMISRKTATDDEIPTVRFAAGIAAILRCSLQTTIKQYRQ